MTNLPEIRICKKCGESKSVSEFGPWRRSKSGLKYNCKNCESKYLREYYKTHPEALKRKRVAGEAWRKANWEKVKAGIYRRIRADPIKHKARQAVNNAIADGKLGRKNCFINGCDKSKAQFHHTHGYDKEYWFTGIWLCAAHHAQLHKELKNAQVS